MYRVLIVEDEMLVRIGIKNSIKWEKYDMEVIADAPDGLAALEIYEKEAPDLIITDIRMPGMNGMELISRIRERDKVTRFIILTCLEEFDLVKKAMSLGVSDYLLKLTMTAEETDKVLKKVVEELNKERKADTILMSPEFKVNKEKLLKDFLFTDKYTEAEFEYMAVKLKLRLNKSRFILCIMEISRFELLKTRFNDEKGQRIKSSISDTLDRLLDSFDRGEAFYDDDSHYILVFNFNDIYSEQILHKELHKILSNIKSAMFTFFNAAVSFGISSIHDGYASLAGIYKEARQALEQKFFLGDGLFFSACPQKFDDRLFEIADTLRMFSLLTRFMDKDIMEQYQAKINKLLTEIPRDIESIQGFFCELLQWTAASLHLRGDFINKTIIACIHKMLSCDLLDDIVRVYQCFAYEIVDNAIKNKALSKEISETVDFARANFHKSINLQQVAEHVGLSPAYVSNLFKKEMKVNFVEYLIKLRIERAKELLQDTRLMSYEIAGKVGFTEETYFCKVFKKVTGISPNEYRRQYMKGRMEVDESESH